jgi:hypothetical protein
MQRQKYHKLAWICLVLYKLISLSIFNSAVAIGVLQLFTYFMATHGNRSRFCLNQNYRGPADLVENEELRMVVELGILLVQVETPPQFNFFKH